MAEIQDSFKINEQFRASSLLAPVGFLNREPSVENNAESLKKETLLRQKMDSSFPLGLPAILFPMSLCGLIFLELAA